MKGKTQSTYVADVSGNIFSIDIANGCAKKLLYSCPYPYIVDIAADQNSNIYICSGDSLFVFNVNNPSAGCVFLVKFFADINGLLVAGDGNVYASGSGLFKYDPLANVLTFLGYFPPDVFSAGDMIEYNGKIYMSASDGGLHELNLTIPQLSTLYCKVGSGDIWGMALVSTKCYGETIPRKRVIAFAQTNSGFASNAYLVDMESKTSFPDFCNLDIAIVGATPVAASDVTAGPIVISAISAQGPLCRQTSDGRISLTVASGNADNYSYSIDGGEESRNGLFENLGEGPHTILIKSKLGCYKDTTITLASSGMPCVDSVFIPRAFTPDGDGLNDIFRAKSYLPVSNFELRIYNRYGENVFTSNDPGKGWDGILRSKQQPVGVYVWFMRYRGYFGRDIVRKGAMALIR